MSLNIGIKTLEYQFDWVVTLDQDSLADDTMVDNILNAWKKFCDDEQKETLSLFPIFIDLNIIDSEFILNKSEFEYVMRI